MHGIRILITAAAMAAAISAPVPAVATDLAQALEICKKNPDCSHTPPSKGGWVDFIVGDNHVACPLEGDCLCLQCNPPAMHGKAPGLTGKVAGVLQQ